MAPFDGDESEMNENPGHVPEPLTPDELDRLQRFAEAFSRPEDADVASQLGASAFAAHLTADNGDPAATPAGDAKGSSRKASGRPRWRTGMAAFGATLLSTFVGKAAVAAAGVAVVAGGVAAADALAGQGIDPDEVVVSSQQDDGDDTDVVEVGDPEADDAGVTTPVADAPVAEDAAAKRDDQDSAGAGDRDSGVREGADDDGESDDRDSDDADHEGESDDADDEGESDDRDSDDRDFEDADDDRHSDDDADDDSHEDADDSDDESESDD